MNVIKRIKDWYRGKPIPPNAMYAYQRYQQPPLAKTLGCVGRWLLANY